ncbi:hypothetical protein CSC17_5848 [Klebsiella oxytoca]|nr:hypothetical protein CSC17_5848 [Klebsiella oxytoca]
MLTRKRKDKKGRAICFALIIYIKEKQAAKGKSPDLFIRH